jgi:hypothetical protein
MSELLDEQLLRRALVAFADVRAPARPAGHRRVRPARLALALVAAVLLIAGSAVAAQRAVLEPFGVFVSTDSRYGTVRDRDFVRQINSSDVPSKIAFAGLVLQRREANGEVRVYATTNVDGSHGIGIGEDGNPQGLGCCASDADVGAPVYVGVQLSRAIGPVAYPDAWAGWVGDRTVSLAVLYSDGSTQSADVDNGYFLAVDHAPPGAHPVALVASAADGSELGRLSIARG